MDFTSISAEDRLFFLQKGDGHRAWRSLDDRRFCVRCSNVFTGREVRIATQPDGELILHCPTDSCDSQPRHWFFCGSGLGRPQSGSATSPDDIDLSGW